MVDTRLIKNWKSKGLGDFFVASWSSLSQAVNNSLFDKLGSSKLQAIPNLKIYNILFVNLHFGSWDFRFSKEAMAAVWLLLRMWIERVFQSTYKDWKGKKSISRKIENISKGSLYVLTPFRAEKGLRSWSDNVRFCMASVLPRLGSGFLTFDVSASIAFAPFPHTSVIQVFVERLFKKFWGRQLED